jgi:stearoyl-CoA desaturase (Delta-9 desaturase)
MFKSDLHALTVIQITLIPALWLFIPSADWGDVAIVAACTWLYSCIGHHVALHRYFTHRQFALPLWRERLLLFVSLFAGLGGPVSYVATHLVHHRHADTEKDLHGPHLGLASFFYSFRGRPQQVRSRLVLDLHRRYGWVDQYYMLILIAIIALVAAVAPWFALTVLILPMCLANWIGAIEVQTQHWGGKSANNFGYFLTFGAVEGLHKNHHESPRSLDCAWDRFQFDWVCFFANLLKSRTVL